MRRKQPFGSPWFFLLLSVLCLVANQALSQPEKIPSIEYKALGWQISNTTVVSEGSTVTDKRGTLTTGYTIQGTASEMIGNTPVEKGLFRLTLSAFTPVKDMPGQKAGFCYLQGDWSIVDKTAPAKERKARHSSANLSGRLSAALDFNPLKDPGVINAAVTLPMSMAGGRWSTGKGYFAGNESFEGLLQFDAEVWPDVAKEKGVTR